MKQFYLVLILCCYFIALAGETPYLRVKIEDEKQLQALAEKGYEFLDARVRYRDVYGIQQPKVDWLPENGFVTLRGDENLAAELSSAGFAILKSGVAKSQPDFISPTESLPFQFGWPKTMTGWPGIYGQATTVDDIDGNGKMDVFISTTEGYVYGWRHNGTFVPGFPLNPFQLFVGINTSGDSVWTSWASTGGIETGAMGDIDGDGDREFVFAKDIGMLFVHQPLLQPMPNFPKDLGLANFSSSPALYDFDNDGADEIVLMTFFWPTGDSTHSRAKLHIFKNDGTEMPGWPKNIGINSDCSPVVGDIDGDYQPEIIVGTGDDYNGTETGKIFSFEVDGSITPGFPIIIDNDVNSTPSLADIDLNGILDIIIRVKPTSTNIQGIYAYNGSGQLLSGFPAVIPKGGSAGAPAIADIDGDGFPDICYGTIFAVDSGMVYAWNYDGSMKPGFPQLVNRTFVEQSVAVADVSGDGLPDIIATTNGVSNKPGIVWAFDYAGNVVPGFPLPTENVVGSSLESAPSIVDMDGDGDTEILTSNWNGTLFCWDSPGISNPLNEWPMFKYNANRSGNQFHQPSAIRNSNGNAGVPGEFSLLANYPNPFNPSTTIRYQLAASGQIRLIIYNMLGQRVKTLRDHFQSAGAHELVWDGKNDAGRQMSSGVYVCELKTETQVNRRKMLLMK